jgi:hypothetical protein
MVPDAHGIILLQDVTISDPQSKTIFFAVPAPRSAASVFSFCLCFAIQLGCISASFVLLLVFFSFLSLRWTGVDWEEREALFGADDQPESGRGGLICPRTTLNVPSPTLPAFRGSFSSSFRWLACLPNFFSHMLQGKDQREMVN